MRKRAITHLCSLRSVVVSTTYIRQLHRCWPLSLSLGLFSLQQPVRVYTQCSYSRDPRADLLAATSSAATFARIALHTLSARTELERLFRRRHVSIDSRRLLRPRETSWRCGSASLTTFARAHIRPRTEFFERGMLDFQIWWILVCINRNCRT